jgi:hypothetical protein
MWDKLEKKVRVYRDPEPIKKLIRGAAYKVRYGRVGRLTRWLKDATGQSVAESSDTVPLLQREEGHGTASGVKATAHPKTEAKAPPKAGEDAKEARAETKERLRARRQEEKLRKALEAAMFKEEMRQKEVEWYGQAGRVAPMVMMVF